MLLSFSILIYTLIYKARFQTNATANPTTYFVIIYFLYYARWHSSFQLSGGTIYTNI